MFSQLSSSLCWKPCKSSEHPVRMAICMRLQILNLDKPEKICPELKRPKFVKFVSTSILLSTGSWRKRLYKNKDSIDGVLQLKQDSSFG